MVTEFMEQGDKERAMFNIQPPVIRHALLYSYLSAYGLFIATVVYVIELRKYVVFKPEGSN